MPLPLFILAGAGAAAVAGKSLFNKKKAADLEWEAEEMIDNAKEAYSMARRLSGKSIQSLGDKKSFLLEGSFKNFIELFQQLKNVEVDDSKVLNELNKLKGNKLALRKLRDTSDADTSIVKSVVVTLGGPIGWLVKSGADLDRARSKYAESEEMVEEIMFAIDGCNAIRRRSYLFFRLLIRLDAIFSRQVFQLKEIIKKRGVDYSKFETEEKHIVAEAMSLATAIKAVLDTPILNSKGRLTKSSRLAALELQAKLARDASAGDYISISDNSDDEDKDGE
jgi:hypothetical protein